QLAEALDGAPLVAGIHHRQAALEQVLENLPPAHAAVDLAVEHFAVDEAAAGFATLLVAHCLAAHGRHLGKGVTASPAPVEGRAQYQFVHFGATKDSRISTACRGRR